MGTDEPDILDRAMLAEFGERATLSERAEWEQQRAERRAADAAREETDRG